MIDVKTMENEWMCLNGHGTVAWISNDWHKIGIGKILQGKMTEQATLHPFAPNDPELKSAHRKYLNNYNTFWYIFKHTVIFLPQVKLAVFASNSCISMWV